VVCKKLNQLSEGVESHLDAIAGANTAVLGAVDKEDLRQQGKGLLARLMQGVRVLRGDE
jgi:hypothetical protein